MVIRKDMFNQKIYKSVLVCMTIAIVSLPCTSMSQPAQDWPSVPTQNNPLSISGINNSVVKIQIADELHEVSKDSLTPEISKNIYNLLPFHGNLIYTLNYQNNWLLVWHKLGMPPKVSLSKRFSAYRIVANDVVYEPQFTPSGKTMFFKLGWPYDSTGQYRLIKWDLQKKALSTALGDKVMLTYPHVYLSPNENQVAYILGCDKSGGAYDELGSELKIGNIKTKQQISISKGIATYLAFENVAWTSQNTILYTKTEKPGTDKDIPYSIYEATVAGNSQLLIHNAYQPAPAPDGDWIAYNGLIPESNNKNLTKDENKKQAVGLCLYNRKHNEYYKISPDEATYLRWIPNSSKLIAMNVNYAQLADKRGEGKMKINIIDATTQKVRHVIDLKQHDYVSLGFHRTSPQFKPIGLSNDGEDLIVLVTEAISNNEKYHFYIKRYTVRDISLTDGKENDITSYLDVDQMFTGWDWYDLSTPAP